MRDLGTGPKNTDELAGSGRYDQSLKAFGSNEPDVLFGGKPTSLTPWPSAAKQKKGQTWNRDLIASALSQPPVLEDVDPRFLTATQPNIVRHHVSHYMGDSYEKTGQTAADQHEVGNQYPVVYRQPQGRYDIISGHHRATVALLKGESLRARVIRDQG